VLTQVGGRLRRVPGFAHPGDRTNGVSPGPYGRLTLGLTPELSQGLPTVRADVPVAARGGVR
jgi:hypothetical protein